MNEIRSKTRTAQLLATLAVAGAALAACVAVPVDSRTGTIAPWPPAAAAATPREVTVITPPAPVAPAPPVVLTARLYPVNDVANRGGLLTAVITDSHSGRGQISFSYLGDAMQGEATRVEAGHPGFGRIHREVLGLAAVQVQGRRGIANAFGARGVNAQCEYVLTGQAQGTGACVFSDGARYQLHFG
ncbi:MAG: hypothetical protein U1E89_09660 [Burkholderiaceae bacterium]